MRLLGLSLLLALGPALAHPAGGAPIAECGWPPPPARDADAVFVGRVTAVREHRERVALRRRRLNGNPPLPADSVALGGLVYEARLAVDSAWKGVDSAEVVVFTDHSGEGMWFKIGARYLILARREPRLGLLATSLCDGSVPYEFADAARANVRLGELGPARRVPAPRPALGPPQPPSQSTKRPSA